MPKRVRCPHCDRLFARDVLDDHIRKCRQKTRKSVPARNKRRRVVVDGNNVAFYLSPDGRPYAKNLVLARNSLVSAGYRPVFVISAALSHNIDKSENLHSFVSQAEVVTARRGMDDDLEIIRTAERLNADIVSNDRFLNWLHRYPWIEDRLRKYRMTTSGLILY